MSIGILVGKIAALFIIMFLGFVLVKTGICRSDDSRILSRLSVYIVVPCSILSAFQVFHPKWASFGGGCCCIDPSHPDCPFLLYRTSSSS